MMHNSDAVKFPATLTAAMLEGFRTTPNGSTHPRVGVIDGVQFIAKCGSWSAHSSDEHVHNEFVADNFLRDAGFNVPESREYWVDFGVGGKKLIRLAVFHADSQPLIDVWLGADESLRQKLREQVVRAYPVQSFIAGIDTFANDNVRVTPEGELLFVDNGADFDYRARGGIKGWFWNRTDIFDKRSGYLSLYTHRDQTMLHEILGPNAENELWTAINQHDFLKFSTLLNDEYRRQELVEYATKLYFEGQK